MLDKMLSVKEAAEALNLSVHTVRSWFYSGKLEGIRLGRRVLVFEKTLKQMVEDGRTKKD